MLRKKAIRKVFITTMSLFIIMTIYTIPIEDKLNSKNVSLEIEYVTSLGNHSIYLLDKNNYLVKMKVLLDSNNLKENIKTIIFFLFYLCTPITFIFKFIYSIKVSSRITI